jgi:hypothetical protein
VHFIFRPEILYLLEFTGNSSGSVQNKPDDGPNGSPTQHILKSTEIPVKSITSSSEQSEDDDLEGEFETLENINPAEAKRMRR